MKTIPCKTLALVLCIILFLCIPSVAIADDGTFTIPADTTRIEADAFAGCLGMTSVSIPPSVASIGENAFSGCDNLKDVFFKTTLSAFTQNGIQIASGNDALKAAAYHFSDGQSIIPITTSFFPDAAFRSYISDKLDLNRDNRLSTAEASRVSRLDLSSRSIKLLTGIEYFPNLTWLNCNNNQITMLDLHLNTALEELYCRYNQMESLDVTGCGTLRVLICDNNKLTGLDLRSAQLLENVQAHNNLLRSLTLSGHNQLRGLTCENNALSNLNISGCPLLKDLMYRKLPVSEGGITGYGGEGGNSLEYLFFDSNVNLITGIDLIPINDVYFPNNVFRRYVSANFDMDGSGTLSKVEIQEATEIRCYRMNISSLKGLEYLTELTYLDCGFNDLYEIDVSRNTKLQVLGIAGNNISNLDLSKNTALKTLSCGTEIQEADGNWYTYGNPLGTLDVTKNTALTYLECPGCNLPSLDVSQNTALQTLNCWVNNLTSLNVSNNRALAHLACSSNPITSLNVSKNTNLERLVCQYCDLTNITFGNNLKLYQLRCRNNPLSSLNLYGLSALQQLDCRNSELTSLNLGGCSALKYIDCSGNRLSTLNVQSCTALTELNCNMNRLTALNVGNCRNLQYLFCWRNNLTSVSLSQNTALIRVNLSANNSLSSLTLGSMQNLEMLWVQNTKLSSLNIRNCPMIVRAYRQGSCTDFGRYGMQIDSGDWVGYQYGSGLNPGSTSPVDHCQFCVNKATQVTT